MANIKIKNIYYMLTYAFSALRQEDYKHIELEDFENASDMFADILTAGLKSLIKQGLNREYIDQTEQLSGLKGKINISESVKENTFIKRKLVCTFDEFSINSYMNRILLTTADLLLRSGIKKESAKALKKHLIYFDSVEMLDRKRIN